MEEGGRGLHSIGNVVRQKEQNFESYKSNIRANTEALIMTVQEQTLKTYAKYLMQVVQAKGRDCSTYHQRL